LVEQIIKNPAAFAILRDALARGIGARLAPLEEEQ
jgi:hypothetical protein